MHMPSFITRFRRDRAASRIVSNGKKRDRAVAARHAINGDYDHTVVDANYLDNVIDSLERRLERDREFIRQTA